MPGITLAGIHKERKKNALIQSSGHAPLDFDHTDDRTDDAIVQAHQLPYAYAAFPSPSGHGVKVIVRIPIVKSADEYDSTYAALLDDVASRMPEFAANLDRTTSDSSRLCFVSHGRVSRNPEPSVFVPPAEAIPSPSTSAALDAVATGRSDSHTLDDADLIQRMLNAENREKARKLWNGDHSAYAKYDPQGNQINDGESEADAALCQIIAFWANKDPERIDAIFRQSKLHRPERWAKADYAQRTIQFAIANCKETYGGKTKEEPSADEPSNKSSTDDLYVKNKSGSIRETQHTYETMLSQEQEWAGRLAYNGFQQVIEIDGRPITSIDRASISGWASTHLGVSGGSIKVRDQAIAVVASQNSHDPLKTMCTASLPGIKNHESEPCYPSTVELLTLLSTDGYPACLRQR